jgi:sporulation protein YlmC with PRC-barrel domain
MDIKLSELLAKRIYTQKGNFVGTVEDVVLDLMEKKIAYISLVPIEGKSQSELVRIFREKVIPYDKVISAAEIVIVADDYNKKPQ